MKVVILGLSITSSWGNGHAGNYRALVRELAARGHHVLFCERDVPWYANSRDLRELRGAGLRLYGSLNELAEHAGGDIRTADLVIVGSFLPEGTAVAEYVLSVAEGRTAFYDIDTPVTLEKLERGDDEYLRPDLIPRFDLYLSFTGGPTLMRLENAYGARRAVAFHCLVDPRSYVGTASRPVWELGYLGTYSPDRQPGLETLLLGPARILSDRSFVVAGAQYPDQLEWPRNVARIEHVAPPRHQAFYSAQRFTLNLTRAAMRQAGWSPSVRLFEAAASGTPIISDSWPGIEEFFTPGVEIIVADSAADVLRALVETPAAQRQAIAARARQRVLREHTAARRVDQLEQELAGLTLRIPASGSRPRNGSSHSG